MLVGDMLRPELIKIPLEARNKRHAISELVDQLVQYHELPMRHRDAVLEELYENEAAVGSGMERGIAVPHVASDRVEDVLCAVGVAHGDPAFKTLDGRKADIVVLVISSKRNYAAEVAALASVEHLLEDDAFLGKLRAARSGREAHEAIAARERELHASA